MSETNPKFLSDRLSEEYERQQALLAAQPAIIQRFLEAQGKQIAEAILAGEALKEFSHWLKLLGGFDVIFLVACPLVFEFVLEE